MRNIHPTDHGYYIISTQKTTSGARDLSTQKAASFPTITVSSTHRCIHNLFFIEGRGKIPLTCRFFHLSPNHTLSCRKLVFRSHLSSAQLKSLRQGWKRTHTHKSRERPSFPPSSSHSPDNTFTHIHILKDKYIPTM